MGVTRDRDGFRLENEIKVAHIENYEFLKISSCGLDKGVQSDGASVAIERGLEKNLIISRFNYLLRQICSTNRWDWFSFAFGESVASVGVYIISHQPFLGELGNGFGESVEEVENTYPKADCVTQHLANFWLSFRRKNLSANTQYANSRIKACVVRYRAYLTYAKSAKWILWSRIFVEPEQARISFSVEMPP